MKFYGHADLQKNQIKNAALETLTAFPTSPVVGQLAFINRIVYICADLGVELPIWVPLTQEITAYTHTATAATTWNIPHNLNTSSVNVQVFGTDNKAIIPDEIEIVNANNVQVTFSFATAGKAVVLSGQFDGNVKPTYAYTFYQNSASSTWVITHNLGYYPIARVFIGANEVQPLTITHDSVNQVTITFSTPQVGLVRLI